MVFLYHSRQVFSVQMGVDLCGKNTFMAQQFLNHAQIRAILYQMRGEGVAKGMRADVLGDPSRLGQSFHELEDTHSAEGTAS